MITEASKAVNGSPVTYSISIESSTIFAHRDGTTRYAGTDAASVIQSAIDQLA